MPFFPLLRLWASAFMVATLLSCTSGMPRVRASRCVALRRTAEVEPPGSGGLNAVWVVGVIVAVVALRAPAREVALVGLAGLSLWRTPRELRRANGFTAAPMVEVAVLFAGIFVTMLPALELLRAHAGGLGVRQPWQFFWATGLLSSVLDNAPTYLVFLALGQGLGLADEVMGVPHAVLAAIAARARGEHTRQCPQLQVKIIAEGARVPMPSFFGYLLYSGGVLLPLFAVAALLFF